MRYAILITLALAAMPAAAQQRTFYDAHGNLVGKAQTDSQGTTTFYDRRGNITGKEFKTEEKPNGQQQNMRKR